jgi:hypothetical protein
MEKSSSLPMASHSISHRSYLRSSSMSPFSFVIAGVVNSRECPSISNPRPVRISDGPGRDLQDGFALDPSTQTSPHDEERLGMRGFRDVDQNCLPLNRETDSTRVYRGTRIESWMTAVEVLEDEQQCEVREPCDVDPCGNGDHTS